MSLITREIVYKRIRSIVYKKTLLLISHFGIFSMFEDFCLKILLINSNDALKQLFSELKLSLLIMVCEDLNFKPGKVNSFMPNTTILERFIYTLSRCVHFSVFTQNMNCVTIIFVNLLLSFSTCVRVNSNARPKQNFRSQKVERQTLFVKQWMWPMHTNYCLLIINYYDHRNVSGILCLRCYSDSIAFLSSVGFTDRIFLILKMKPLKIC